MTPSAADEDFLFPERPIGLVQRLLPRDADILEQMLVEIAQVGALPATLAPTQRFVQQPIPAMSRIDDGRLWRDV
jgi:hypothetical protein